MNLKDLITSKGFRFKKIIVSEWDNAVLQIREPAVQDWELWAETIRKTASIENDIEKVRIRVEAEAKLFAAILCDENGNHVFTGDITDLINSYGPIHSRILNQALSLADIGKNPIEDAEKK